MRTRTMMIVMWLAGLGMALPAVVSAEEARLGVSLFAQGGGNLPTNELDAGPKINAGLTLDLPQLGEVPGQFYVGGSFSWWDLERTANLSSPQLTDNPRRVSLGGDAYKLRADAGYRFPAVAERIVFWTGIGVGEAFYDATARALGTRDHVEGGNVLLGAETGAEVGFDFGGALQVLVGYEYTEADDPVLGSGNLGGFFVGAGWRQQLWSR